MSTENNTLHNVRNSPNKTKLSAQEKLTSWLEYISSLKMGWKLILSLIILSMGFIIFKYTELVFVLIIVMVVGECLKKIFTKVWITIALLVVVTLVMSVTNPATDMHVKALYGKQMAGSVGEYIDMGLSGLIGGAEYKNYLLFSYVELGGKPATIGFLNNVFILK